MSASLQLSLQLGIRGNDSHTKILLRNNSNAIGSYSLFRSVPRSILLKQYSWSSSFPKRIYRRTSTDCTNHQFRCSCFLNTGPSLDPNFVKCATSALTRSFDSIQRSPVIVKLASTLGIFIFAIWGLRPLVQMCRNIILQKNDANWKKSNTYLVTTSYVQPLLLWMGAIFICRTLDPVNLPTEAGQIVKQRLLTFVRSLSTVLAFAYCLSSVIQQLQKYIMETRDSTDAGSMGFQFASKAVYTAVWIAAVSLFMELLGFSTQRWLTAGGLGTVLLTLAGREIFTNFLSSAIIHATRPFVVNEWIQTKIEGYEVSGTVERVGWWSPTIIRGEDREAVHIPNHKFTMNVVRNLTQKNHWRIKTHIAISHLDVRKISSIVADMRKVLSKNPQVEHKKLHRRVFLENINPENQALMILVSCFVKTSHMEEYLCVKEAILLDLLRVVRHHRARLATPIRTFHKAFPDADLDNVPFSESMYDRGEVLNRPMLLIEPASKINGEDKPKSQSRPPRAAGEKDLTSDPKSKVTSSTEHITKEIQTVDTKSESELEQMPKLEKKEDPMVATKASGSTNNSSDSSKQSQKAGPGTTPNSGSLHDSGARRPESQTKHDGRQTTVQMPTSKSSLEENIVLGVALEGSKRTLPIEEEIEHPLNAEDTKELATSRSGNSNGPEKEKSDNKKQNSPGSQGNDM